MNETSLGVETARLSKDILTLMLHTEDSEQKRELREQLSVILDHTATLIEGNVAKDSEEYAAATNTLVEAAEKVEDAQKNTEKVADALRVIAKVTDVLGNLAVQVAGM